MNHILSAILLSLGLFFTFSSCQKASEVILEDYSESSSSVQLDLTAANGRVIPATFEKPVGQLMDVVLLMPEKDNAQLEEQIAERYFENGYMVLRLDRNAFYGDHSGQAATMAAIRFLKKELNQYNIELGNLIVQGSFEAASEAFLAALNTKVDALILTEPTADTAIWQEARQQGGLTKLATPFLLISAEERDDRIEANLTQLENSYHNCKDCHEGSQFVYHPGTEKEWNQDVVWQLIFEFLEG